MGGQRGQDPRHGGPIADRDGGTGGAGLGPQDPVDALDQVEHHLGDRTSEVEIRGHAVPQLGGEVVGPTDGAQATAVQHGHAIGDPPRFTEEVGGEDHRAPLLACERPDQIGDVAGGGRIEPGRGFVEEQDLRVVQQGPGEGEPLALTGREPGGAQVRHVGHREPFQLDADSAVGLLDRVATHASRVLEVLAGGEPVVESGVLGQHAGAASDLVAVDGGVEPEHPGLAPIGGQNAVEHADRGGLAGAVRAEQGEHLAAVDFQIQPVHRDPTGERSGERAGDDRRFVGRVHRLRYRPARASPGG